MLKYTIENRNLKINIDDNLCGRHIAVDLIKDILEVLEKNPEVKRVSIDLSNVVGFDSARAPDQRWKAFQKPVAKRNKRSGPVHARML